MNPEHVKFLNVTLWWNHFLCLFGLSVTKEIGRDVNNVRYTTSSLKIVYSLVVLAGIICSFSFQLGFANNISSSSSVGLTILTNFMVYGVSFVSAFIILSSLFQNKNYAIFQNKCIKIEFKLPTVKDLNVIRQKSMMLFIFWSIIIIGSIGFDIALQLGKGVGLEFVLNILAGYTFLTYNIVTVAHFGMIQLWLQKSFLRVNNELVRCCTSNNKDNFMRETKRSVLVLEDFIRNPTPPKVEQRILHSIGNSKHFTMKENHVTQNIKKLRMLYNEIFKISRIVDQIFSAKCLIIAFSNLSMGTLMIFFTMKLVGFYAQRPSEELLYRMLSFVKNVFMSLFTTAALIWPCGGTCKEARNTALIIQDTLADTQHDELSIAELKDFALQVQQERVYFSPYGLFYIENKTLVSVLATMTSYLVILIQFFPMNSNNNNSNNPFS